MYKLYFKQAIQLLTQNKFISIISIAGTALAIMFIMVIIVSQEIKDISLIPEINRSKTLYVKYETKSSKDSTSMASGYLSYEVVKKYFYTLVTPDIVTAIVPVITSNVKGNNQKIKADIRQTDSSFWKMMSFQFIQGSSFSQADFNSGLRKAVVSENVAKIIYKTDQVLGKEIEIERKVYKIVGVVKEVSPIFEYAYGEIWIPYSSKVQFEANRFHVLLLTNGGSAHDIEQEVRKQENKYNEMQDEYNITFFGPYNHRIQQMNITNHEPDVTANYVRIGLIFLILLLVPALNLSGFSLSSVNKRISEIAVRKSFGAKQSSILFQILYENFIFSLAGGILGLICSYFVVIQMKDLLLDVSSESSIPIAAIVSWSTFLGVFLVCVLLNILSAGLSAYKASKLSIVNSIKYNSL